MHPQKSEFSPVEPVEDALIITVNDQDEVVGAKPRSTLRPNDLYRCTALFITNPEEQLLLARRAENKRFDPGKWSVSAAGTVEVGETYESNIIKEAEEELGLSIQNLVMGEKIKIDLDSTLFVHIFTAQITHSETSLRLQESEVAEAGWWSISEIKKALRNEPDRFAKGFPRLFEAVFSKSNISS